MSDTSKAFRKELSMVDATADRKPGDDRPVDLLGSASAIDDVIHVLEERLTVAKRRRAIGSVKVGTRTELVEAVAEADLDRYRVEVTRVPIGRVVDEAPAARAEGDVTVIPVIEERLVVVKQLFLVEEVRIRHVLERETVTESVRLRRQHAVVERLDGPGARMRRGDADDPAHN